MVTIPAHVKLAPLTCTRCGHAHAFGGWLEGKDKVVCPKCKKVHSVMLGRMLNWMLNKSQTQKAA